MASTSDADFSLRIATSGDVSVVMQIVNEAYSIESDSDSGVAFKTGARFPTSEEPAVFVDNEQCIVACDHDGKVLGTICFDLDYHGDTSQGEFGPLAVRPECAKRGIARSLINEAESRMRSVGCNTMRLVIVDARTDLPPFYERLGFSVAGEEEVDRSLPQYEKSMATITKPVKFIVYAKDI